LIKSTEIAENNCFDLAVKEELKVLSSDAKKGKAFGLLVGLEHGYTEGASRWWHFAFS
jgi:hypothetical protein